jgi:hypothetical protein
MSEISREAASWRRGKTPVVLKYIDDHAKLLSETAGRGFLSMPGFVYGAENGLELSAKMNLSELNYKILSETIEREIKAAGIDYGLAYKNAVIVWELEKQTLLDLWAKEYAGIKQDMAGSEEVLNLLAIEVSKRAITLLEGKTAIEEEAETYKLALVNLDGTVSPYEVQLANAKLLTAQRKLLIIPVLQEIITKEQELLVREGLKADAFTQYMAAEQAIAAKKQTLEPVINELATKVDQLADKITSDQIPAEQAISDEKMTQAEIAVEKAGFQVDEIATEIEIAGKALELDTAKRSLEVTRFNNEQELASSEIDLNRGFHAEEGAQFNALLADERATQSLLLDGKRAVHTKNNAMKVKSATTIGGAGRQADSDVNTTEIDQIKREATAEAATKITAALTHLIG